MNKRELIDAIAAEAAIDARAAGAALDALAVVLSRELSRGEQVAIAGWGTFEARTRAARTGRNPRTGEAIEIAASIAPAFKPAPSFKRAISGSDAG